MNILVKISILIVSFSFYSNCKCQIHKQSLKGIAEMYIDKYAGIENPCDEKPYYKIQFMKKDSITGFWVAAYLGLPGLVPPTEPGKLPDENPIEIKGFTYLNGKQLIIYDYKNSDGYGLYDPLSLKPYKIGDFNEMPDSCVNVWYPEAWYYSVTRDSIYLTDRREAFQLK